MFTNKARSLTKTIFSKYSSREFVWAQRKSRGIATWLFVEYGSNRIYSNGKAHLSILLHNIVIYMCAELLMHRYSNHVAG